MRGMNSLILCGLILVRELKTETQCPETSPSVISLTALDALIPKRLQDNVAEWDGVQSDDIITRVSSNLAAEYPL